MKRSAITSVAAPAMPLIAGGLIYVLWRSTSLLMFRWFDAVHLTPIIQDARFLAAGLRPHLPGWLLYSLPDAAWASCGIFLFAAIWSGSHHPARHFWVLLAPALAIGGEFAQFLHVLPGTFDLADVTACAAVSAGSLVWAKRLFGYEIGRHKAQSV